VDLGSLLSGPIGALAGAGAAIAQKVIDYKDRNAQRAHDLAMRDKDREHLAMELQARSEIAKVDADTAIAVREFDAVGAAIAADRATYGDSLTGRIVDLVRGLIRPVVTVFAMALLLHVTAIALRVPMAPQDAIDVLREVLFIAGNVVGYWFGARSSFGRRGR
jgi:hypothetical protein